MNIQKLNQQLNLQIKCLDFAILPASGLWVLNVFSENLSHEVRFDSSHWFVSEPEAKRFAAACI